MAGEVLRFDVRKPAGVLMHGGPNFKLIVATALVVIAAVACWHVAQYHKHRIVVVFPDGAPAPRASVSLDYDFIFEHPPRRLTANEHGVLYLSREHAYGSDWEWMNITAYRDGRNFHAKRGPEECKYPMTVVLQEHKTPAGVDGRTSAVEQAREIGGVIRRVASGLVR